ncbi:MAG TPA: thiamine pyrophosphate-dependent enzyme, partial [Acidobacteriota bacterium]|nr:thiamine pyrophosphate-dependent enzyme [Acidobacteriota bacterium]
NIPIVIIVQNNRGYMSIRGGQRKFMGRHVASEFNYHKRNGEPYSAKISEVAKNFGLEAWKIDQAEELRPALEAAFASGGPALVEVTTSRDAAGPFVPGWWDFPSPEYYEPEQAEYAEGRALEQHL